MFFRFLMAMVIVEFAFNAGCISRVPQPKSSRKTKSLNEEGIHGAGATFPAPLYEKWIEEYQAENPGRSVSYDVVGSGAGVDQFLAEKVDFGASDTALSDKEIATVERGAFLIPVTAGSIVIAYHLPDVSDELKLSREVYVDIFLGEITLWNDERIKSDNPALDLPNRAIVVVARQDSSGTTFAFTNHLSAVSQKWSNEGPGTVKLADWPGNVMLAKGNEGVAAQIKRSPWTIGYVQYGIAESVGLQMASLENKADKFIQPDGKSGLATLGDVELPTDLKAFFPDPSGADSYPIVTLTWLLLYKQYDKLEKVKEVKDFVTWCLNDGQQYSESLGYIRLAPQVQFAALEKLAEVGTKE